MNKYKVYWFQKKSIDYLGTFETYKNAKNFISWVKKMYGNTGNENLPHNFEENNIVVYTGTHDNQTILGWCEDRYPDMDAKQTSEKLMQILDECDADVKIVPLQDLLGLGDESRMNMPGTTDRNWSWQAKKLPD